MRISRISLCFAFVLAVLLGVPVVASAASSCKNLSNNACASSRSCTWVKAYTRKDGRRVKGYCRKLTPAKTRKGAVAPKKKTLKRAGSEASGKKSLGKKSSGKKSSGKKSSGKKSSGKKSSGKKSSGKKSSGKKSSHKKRSDKKR